tara:strand:+ start:386 stop:997 length:612 start_codon:yes stop_codon:yes gene_type:complete
MTKQKIVIDESFILNSAYEKYKYLTEYMVHGQDGNYNIPGISDYPFYSYFSTLVDDTTILEIGTSLGGSAVMMSYNEKNNIISYDIVAKIRDNIDRSNIEFRIGNFMNDEIDYDQIDLMTLDASHTGRDEVQIFKYIEENWKGGLLYLDDVHNNSDGDMIAFWNGIDRERHEVIDISDIAHGQRLGSGLVNFNRYFDLEIVGG